MIDIRNVSKGYTDENSRTRNESYVLSHIDLKIVDNEFVCVLGKSGCGKSTLLNLLAGYLKPDTGSIFMDNQEVVGPSKVRGVVFQEHALFPWYTVMQNIAFGPMINKKDSANDIAAQYLKAIDMENYRDYYPAQLSGGMKQRVGIARAFANEPDVLLMDEPFSALDNNTRESMQKELLQIWGVKKTTVIFITHSIDEAILLADRVIVLGHGEVVADTKIELERPRARHSDAFINYIDYFGALINDEAPKAMLNSAATSLLANSIS